MERLFQQQQLVAAAEAMQAAGNLSPDVQHQLMNILAAGTLNSSGAAQFNMKPEYGQHVYGRHQGHAGGVMPGMSMPPHGMLQSAGHHPVPVNPLGMMDMHLPGAMPHAHLPFCPSPSSSSLSNGAEGLGCMSEEDGSSKRRGTSDGVFIFTRRRAGQKERTSNEPVALSKKRLQELFDFPLKEAATQLGISMTAMKKACRRMGLERWPYRKAPSCPASYSTALTSTALSGSAAWWGENNGNNKSGGKNPAGSTSSPPNGEGGASTASGQTTATPSVSPSDSGSPQAALSSERKSAEKQQEEGQSSSSSSSSSNNNNNNKSSSNNNGNGEVKAKHDATEMMRMGPEGKMSVSNLLFDSPG